MSAEENARGGDGEEGDVDTGDLAEVPESARLDHDPEPGSDDAPPSTGEGET